MTKAEKQWREAVESILSICEVSKVEALRQVQNSIIIKFEGWELKRME